MTFVLGVVVTALMAAALLVLILALFIEAFEDRRSERAWRSSRDALERIYRNN